jgi:hypothetical protein
MATLNMFRGILVAGAVFAAIVAAFLGQWAATFILGAGILMHGALWLRLHRERQAAAARGGAPQAPTASPS